MILERFAPAAVLVDAGYQVLYYAGPNERYLRQPRGAPSTDVLSLAREGLRAPLRGALRRAAEGGAAVVVPDASVKRDGGFDPVRITVTPVARAGADERLLLAVFQEASPPPARGPTRGAAPGRALVRQLEEELRTTKEDLQSTIERYANSAEELRASNEEVVSANEELQSTNEELESSKEELQSLNEELNAVNQQLQTKLGELEVANNDLRNLIESSDVATLCLDRELRIKWFTPAARAVLRVIPGDVGRPIADLGSVLAGESLLNDARAVIDELAPAQCEVHDAGGRWFQRRTLPYRSAEDRVGGVIVNFVDITETRRAAERALAARRDMNQALEERAAAAGIQVRALAAQLALAEEREREAIARDLHDNLAQLLHVAKLKVAALARAPADETAGALLRELDALCAQAEASVRSLVFQLNPPVLAELGLVPALQWLAEEMRRSHGLVVAVRDDGAPKPLQQSVRSVVYRAVRELLINVAKHSGVGHAEVILEKADESVRIAVHDDGRGFDVALVTGSAAKGLGLVSVRERMGFVGGSAEIRSVPGDGTEAVLRVPLRAAAGRDAQARA